MVLVVKNANIVFPESIIPGCIAIDDGKIISISTESNLPPSGKVIDAKHRLVFPGFIDAHVHFSSLITEKNGYVSETRSAAFGGVTTVIDYMPPEAGTDVKGSIRRRLEMAKPSIVDYALHAIITQANHRNLGKRIDDALDSGITSFKFFMAYKEEDWIARNDLLFDAFSYLGQRGALPSVHAEDGDLVNHLDWKHRSEQKTSPDFHRSTRPNFVEEIAVNTALTLARAAKSELYVVHLSTLEGLDAIRRAKERRQKVWAETCPHYLLLTEKIVDKLGPLFTRCVPPLRSDRDVEALWKGIADRTIDVISSDHSFLSSDLKKDSAGLPGVETRLPLLYTEAVVKRGMSPCVLSDLMSSRPASIFGIPFKGRISVGFDADLVFINPKRKQMIKSNLLHSAADYTPFDGFEVTGIPELTMIRGEVVCEDQQIYAEPGFGRFLFRKSLVSP